MKRRVVITGMGVVSALGMGADNFWNSIKEGKTVLVRLQELMCQI